MGSRFFQRTRRRVLPFHVWALAILLSVATGCRAQEETAPSTEPLGAPELVADIELPAPVVRGGMSVAEAIHGRRSVRSYHTAALSLHAVGQLLWAAQGITHPRGLRTSPSAGATYPLETYLVVGHVDGCVPGIYRYDPAGHRLEFVRRGDHRRALAAAALGQQAVQAAPASLVLSAIYERTTDRYGERGIRYVHMEAGHAAQNVSLQAVALGLGTVVIGAFDEAGVREVLTRPAADAPLYILPVGHVRP